jgi:hypothetical protein
MMMMIIIIIIIIIIIVLENSKCKLYYDRSIITDRTIHNNRPDSFFNGATGPSGPGPLYYRGFMITLRHTTLGRTSLDERSAQRRVLYLTKHNTLKRQTSMPPAEFETAIAGSERQQTSDLDRAANGIGRDIVILDKTTKIAYLTNVAISNSHNLHSTITEKLQKYTDLK